MTPNEKDYMDRYIYQVIRRLPRKQRGEVRMELEELISDMYADKGSMEQVLSELGDPAEFAKQYQSEQQYLIGPEYYETYLWFVKVVLLCAVVPILVISLINAIGEIPAFTTQNAVPVIVRIIAEGLTEGITDALVSCMSAFGAVTLIFAVMEWKKIQFEIKKSEKWSVEHLSEEKKTADARWTPKFLEPVPDKRAVISRADSIVGIVFEVIFCVLLIFAPNFFSFIFTGDGTVTAVPVFNLDQWGMILPVFLVSLLVGLADEVLRLVIGVYCKPVMISSIISSVIQLVLCVVVLKILPIWNPDFVWEVQAALDSQENSMASFFARWNGDMVSNILLCLIVLITLLETGTTIYKTLRYGVPERK